MSRGRSDPPEHSISATSFDAIWPVLQRRWLTVLVVVVFVAGSAYAYSTTQNPIYAASADVLLSRQNLATSLNKIADPGANTSDYNRVAQTQANLATAPTVVRLALQAAGLPPSDASKLTKHSTVTAKPDADILTFEVRNGDSAMAERLVAAYARSYTVYRRTVDTFGVNKALEGVRRRISTLSAHPAGNKRLLESLRSNEEQLNTLGALQTSNAFLVRSPDSATKVSPKPIRSLVIGLLLGALLGVGMAVLRDALDKRVNDPDEIGDRLELPLLARIPELSKRQRQSHHVVMLAEPTGQNAESFRVLKTNVEFATMDGDTKTIMVSSAVQGEGKSTTAANLAIAFARAGRRVALVDVDLRRPYLAKIFELEGRPGVTDLALGRVHLQEALVPVDISAGNAPELLEATAGARGSLRVLPSGLMPPDTGEFVGSRRLKTILAKVAHDADLVLLDAPPLLSVGDALTLSASADAVLYVARLTIIRRSMFKDVRRILDTSPARVLGYVVAGVPMSLAYGYGYGYGYTATNGALEPTGEAKPTAPVGGRSGA